MSDVADAAKKKAEGTKYTGQSTKGNTARESADRVAQGKAEGAMADKAAVREGMGGNLAERAAAGREITRRRKSLGEGNVDFGSLGKVTPGAKKMSNKSAGGSR